MSLLLALLVNLGLPEPVPQQEVLVVVGAEGTAEYGESFAKWTERWRAAAQRGGAALSVVGLGETGQEAAPREQLQRRLRELQAPSSEPLWIVLIGHGTFDGEQAKFNLVGPDISAGDLQSWLKPVQRPVVIINCASASGPFINALSGEHRIVVTATKSGHEQNYARFGDFLSESIGNLAADLDKDEQTSLLEAFVAASRQVEQFYAAQGRLATEHALLDDNGDQRGTPGSWFRGVRPQRAAAEGAAPDGLRAHQLHLVRSSQERLLSPEARAQRDQLELEIEALRQRKGQFEEDEYYSRLEPLMLKLAHLYNHAATSAAP